MVKRRTLLLLVVGLLVAAAVFGGVRLTTQDTYGVDVKMQSLIQKGSGAEGYGCTGGACSNNPPGPGTSGNLIRWSEYIASWSPTQIGQQVVVQGGIKLAPGYVVSCGIDNAHYTIVLHYPDGDGIWRESTVLNNDVSIGAGLVTGVQTTAEVDWEVISPDTKVVLATGSWIHASFSIHCAPILGLGGGWYEQANQNAVLVSGIGGINFEKGQYLVGTNAIADYHVGYVNTHDGKPSWTWYITSGAQGGKTVATGALSQTDGSISYTIVPADFNINGAENTNILTIHLKNTIVDGAWDKTTTITQEALALAPSCSISGTSPQSPKQGQAVTVNFKCTAASSDPKAAITAIYVYWGYGTDQITHVLSASATSDSFVAGFSGSLRVEVVAWAGAIGSNVQKADVQIDHQPTDPCLIDPAKCVSGSGIPLWVIFVLIGIAIILLAALVPFIPIWPWKIVLILAGTIFILVAVLVA